MHRFHRPAARFFALTLIASAALGAGCADMAQTAAVISEAMLRGQAQRQQQDNLRGEARFVQVVGTRAEYGQNGQPVLRLQVRNGSRYNVGAVHLLISYLNGQTVLAQDGSCAGQTFIGSGQVTVLTCAFSQVRGANGYRVDVANVQFR
jgi:hypothetical protein